MSERHRRYIGALISTAMVVVGGTVLERYFRHQVHPTIAGYVEIATIALLGVTLIAQGLYVFRPANRHAIENERRLNEAQAVAGLGSWEWDLRADRFMWSIQQHRLLGVGPGDLEPTLDAYLAFVHPNDRAHMRTVITTAVESRQGLDSEHGVIRRDGSVRIVRTRGELVLNAAGVPVKMIGTTQDVTERAEMAEALRISDERFQLASRATSDALCDWNIAKNEVWWNEGFYALFGYTPSEVESTVDFWIAHIHPDDRDQTRRSVDECLRSTDDVWSGEYRFRRQDRSHAWVFDRRYVVRDARGAAQRVIGSMMDITTRKEADRMKSDFVSFVSHQLRTPLAGMNWMLELANDSPSLPDETREYITDARESAQRLVLLVNDLLDISRLESGKVVVTLEALDLQKVTHAVLHETKPLADAKSQHLTVDARTTQPVRADEQLLRQVIGNLISNAIKYTPQGGSIDIRIGQQNGSAHWTVTDSGIGIPDEAKPHLFEKFYRATNAVSMAAEGTGLGLHLVRLVIEQFGGRVSYESAEQAGSTFGFTLPTDNTI